MALKVENVDLLRKYFSGVVERAKHHAPNVNDVIYRLLGILILIKDENQPIEVRGSHEDKTGNILWVSIDNVRYAFRYEHSDQTIEIRVGSYNGTIVLKVDNSTPTNQIISTLKK